MPPKKSKRKPPPTEPGVAKQYLLANFDNYKDAEVKNGHVLCFYIKNEKSVVKTIAQLKKLLPAACIKPYQVTGLVDRSLNYYRHLTNVNEMQKFQEVCETVFKFRDPGVSVVRRSLSAKPSASSQPIVSIAVDSPDFAAIVSQDSTQSLTSKCTNNETEERMTGSLTRHRLNKTPYGRSGSLLFGVSLVSSLKTSNNEISLGVITVPHDDLTLDSLRRTLSDFSSRLPQHYCFLTPKGWPIDVEQESSISLSQIATSDNEIRVFKTFKKPRVEVYTEDSAALGFVFTDLNVSVCEFRETLIDQLGSAFSWSSVQFLDRGSCPVSPQQEETLTLLDLITNTDIFLVSHVIVRRFPVVTSAPLNDVDAGEAPLKRMRCIMPQKSFTSVKDIERLSSVTSETEDPSKQILLSYVRAEAANHALSLKHQLTRLGYSVFLDVHEIRSGVDWQDSLNYAVTNCQVFVPLVTDRYGETLWTNREVKLADVLSKFVLPVNFLDTWPPKTLAIQFATTQFIPWKSSPSTSNANSPVHAGSPWEDIEAKSVANQIADRVNEQLFQSAASPVQLLKRVSTLKSCAMFNLPSELDSLSQHREGKPLIVICLHPVDSRLGEHIKSVLLTEGYDVWCSTDITQTIEPTHPMVKSPTKCPGLPTTDFRREFQQRADDAGLIITLLSAVSTQSKTCQQQVFYCEQRKRILAVTHEDFEMTTCISMLIGDQPILDSRHPDFDESLRVRVRQSLQPDVHSLTRPLSESEDRISQQVVSLRQKLPSEVCVYTSGCQSTSPPHKTQEICKAIGKHLAGVERLSVATGSCSGLGAAICRSYEDHRQPSAEPLHHIIPSDDEKASVGCHGDTDCTAWPCGSTIVSGCCMSERESIVSRALDICILIVDNPGRMHEAERFTWNDRLVIPVMCTGASGKQNVARQLFKCPVGVREDDWRTLNNMQASAEDIGRCVARVVCVLRDKLRQETTKKRPSMLKCGNRTLPNEAIAKSETECV